jgi:sugar phosphate isomerase/epimerase
MSTAIGEIKPTLYSVTYMGHWYRGPALSLEDVLERARRFGFEGVEIEARRPHGSPLDWPRERCKELRRSAGDEGLAITGIGALNDFSSPIAEYRESQLAAVRELVRMTRDLDAGILRVFLGWTGSTRIAEGGARYDVAQKVWDAAHEEATEDEVWAWCRECLAEAARFAGEHGVVLALQNHKPILRSYRQLLQMVREVGSPHLKVCLDAPLMESRDAEYLRQAVQETGPLQVLTHYFGEFERPAPGSPIRLVDKRSQWRGPFVRHGYVEENFYLPFVQALLETGYRGSIGYELCSPLPVVDGRTVGIDFVDECAQLALEFMRETISAAKHAAVATSAREPVVGSVQVLP